MAKKFLDYTGLTTVWNKITTLFARKTEVNNVQTELTNFMKTKGAANGLASLDEKGQIPSTQLPSYVDDVIEGYLYDGKFYIEENHTTVINGEGSKIYVDLSDMNTYRWSGTAFVLISKSITIGGQPGQAFDGALGAQLTADVNRLETGMTSLENIVNGKAEAAALTSHTNNKSNPHGVTASQIGTYTTSEIDNMIKAKADSSALNNYVKLNNTGDVTITNSENKTTIDSSQIHLKARSGQVNILMNDASSVNNIVFECMGRVLRGDILNGRYEILDESMALSASDINAICV